MWSLNLAYRENLNKSFGSTNLGNIDLSSLNEMFLNLQQMRVNQCDYDEDFIFNHEELESETKLHPQTTFIGKTQGRTNVINEIIQAERDYVKHLRDVVEVSKY